VACDAAGDDAEDHCCEYNFAAYKVEAAYVWKAFMPDAEATAEPCPEVQLGALPRDIVPGYASGNVCWHNVFATLRVTDRPLQKHPTIDVVNSAF
jgi:hypothetical protein